VEGCFRFLIVALFNAHGEGCVLAEQRAWEACTTNAGGVSVGVESVVEVYVHEWRGVCV
jgi:hypothetical protein